LRTVQKSTALVIKRALVVLQRMTGLDIQNFRISRLDLAVNLRMERPVAYYLNRLSYLPKYARRAEGSTLYFNSKSKVLCFYNKKEETIRRYKNYDPEFRGKELDEDEDEGKEATLQSFKNNRLLLDNKNILRYELRLLREVSKQFINPDIALAIRGGFLTCKHLVHHKIYNQYAGLLLKYFQGIIKTKICAFNPSNNAEFLDYLLNVGIKKLGRSYAVESG
jgi:hypothetical protein